MEDVKKNISEIMNEEENKEAKRNKERKDMKYKYKSKKWKQKYEIEKKRSKKMKKKIRKLKLKSEDHKEKMKHLVNRIRYEKYEHGENPFCEIGSEAKQKKIKDPLFKKKFLEATDDTFWEVIK